MALEFIDSLPKKDTRRIKAYEGRWFPVAEELRAHPGQWACFGPRPESMTPAAFRTMFRSTAKRHGLEATIRTVDGVLTAYMRAPEQS